MLEVEAVGAADPEETWRRYTDTACWPGWAPQIRAVRGLSGPIAPGDRGWVLGPGPVRVPVRILAVDARSRAWSWRVGVGPLAVVMDHGVTAAGDGSRAWVRLHAPRALARPYAPLARVALRRLVRG